MRRAEPARWAPLVAALTIWFAHFMVCWAASELVWPGQWAAHAVAGAATVIALTALWFHRRSLRAPPAGAHMAQWDYRFGKGAVALATVAVLFNALPAIVFLPSVL
jgi:hypothetical protein